MTIPSVFLEAPRPAYSNSKVLQEIYDIELAHIMAFDDSDYAQVVELNSIK